MPKRILKMKFPVTIVWLMLWTVCIAQDCKEPPPRKETEILSGSWLEESYPEGTQAVYKCRPGYRTLGSISMICTGGKWVARHPARICRKRPCGHPGDTPFGSFQLAIGDTFEYGAKVVYTCDEGHQMVGEINYRECEADGWTNDIPLCEVVKCLPVTAPENGRIISSALESDQEFIFGHVVRFECNSGFRLNGYKEVHCSENGIWSGEIPKCVEIACNVPKISNGYPVSEKKIYKEKERLQYKCHKGFEYSEKGDAVCTASGWSPEPLCKEVTCNHPYIPNGVYKPEMITYRTEDEITYECKDGFSPATQATVKCTITGWVPAPRCIFKPCDHPIIKNGKRVRDEWKNNYPIGTYYYYECHKNFVTPSQYWYDTITCTQEGWRPALPCRRKCIFNYLENGHYVGREQSRLQGESIRVECYRGYSLENEQSTMTCTETGWVPPPKCIQVKTCSKSDVEIENGFISESTSIYQLHQEAQYRCKPGFLTEAGEKSGSLKCLQSGWSVQPVCFKSCAKPVFEHGKAKSDSRWYKLNDKVDYECDHGYESRDGRSTGSIVCGDTGWSHKPACYEKECMIPKIDSNLIIQPSENKYKIGDVVKMSCRQKLFRVGPDSVQCYQFGWSPNFPTCKGEVKSCGRPPLLHNGQLKEERGEEYDHTEVVEYVCNPTYMMKGSNKIQCIDGEWTALPKCIEEKRTCGETPALANGFAVSGVPPYHHGDSVQFSCGEEFTLIGHRSVTCTHGTWSQLPECIATNTLKKCKKPKRLTNEPLLAGISEFDHGNNVTYKCRDKGESKYSTCINGKWDPEINCKEASKQVCPPPPQIPHAEAMATTVNYQEGEKIPLLCEENYLMEEGEEIVCQDGRWQSIPQCVEKISCPELPHIEHGTVQLSNSSENSEVTLESTTYPHGTKLSYTCGEGFRRSEEREITCHMGKWSSLPQCVGLPCGPPSLIAHGVLSLFKEDPYQYGEKVTYSCTEGFGINGSATVECLGGKWSRTPECIDTSCYDLPTFDDAILTGSKKESYRSGEQVAYKCPKDYQIDGSNTVQCIKGNWIGRPICRDASCGEPPIVQNSVIRNKKTRYRPGERVSYECTKPFDLFGNMEVSCLSGTWTKPPECKNSKGKCGQPPPINNGDIISPTTQVYAPGSSVEYQCKSYYVLQGEKNVVCSNGQWSKPPECLEPCVITRTAMDEHNIMLRWKHGDKLYSKSGEPVEFFCKKGYKIKTNNSLRVSCDKGTLIYPTCIKTHY